MNPDVWFEPAEVTILSFWFIVNIPFNSFPFAFVSHIFLKTCKLSFLSLHSSHHYSCMLLLCLFIVNIPCFLSLCFCFPSRFHKLQMSFLSHMYVSV